MKFFAPTRLGARADAKESGKGMPKRAPGEFSCDDDDDGYVSKQLVKDFDGVSFLGQVVPRRPAITLPRVTVTRRVRGLKDKVRPDERCRSWDG